jgi:hypothetical protein
VDEVFERGFIGFNRGVELKMKLPSRPLAARGENETGDGNYFCRS